MVAKSNLIRNLEREIGEKAKLLAETQGHLTGGECDFLASESERVYETDFSGKKLRVIYGTGEANGVHNTLIRIEFNGKEVYSESNGQVSRYIPGLWRKAFVA